MVCKNINGIMTCGMLHGGGTVKKSGPHRLAKGERVYTAAALKKLAGKGCAGKKKGKKCSCKKK